MGMESKIVTFAINKCSVMEYGKSNGRQAGICKEENVNINKKSEEEDLGLTFTATG